MTYSPAYLVLNKDKFSYSLAIVLITQNNSSISQRFLIWLHFWRSSVACVTWTSRYSPRFLTFYVNGWIVYINVKPQTVSIGNRPLFNFDFNFNFSFFFFFFWNIYSSDRVPKQTKHEPIMWIKYSIAKSTISIKGIKNDPFICKFCYIITNHI